MNRAARSFNTLCAFLVTAGGLAALTGWILHIDVLTRLNPSFIPTQFNSAVCFAFYGLGLGALNWQWRWIARALAGVVLAIGLLSLIEHLANVRFGIDTLAGYYLSGPAIHHPGRMAASTALAIVSLGGALILFSLGELNERKSAIVAVLGSVAAAVGLGGYLSFAAHLHSTTGWVGFTQIGFPSATLCLLAGVNVLLNVRTRFKASATWLPIPLGAGLLALLVTLTQALSADQDAAFSQRIQTAAWDLEGETETQMHDLFAALDRMTNRWNVAGGTPQTVWESDATGYLKSYPGLAALVLADDQGRILRLVGGRGGAVGDQILSDENRRAAAARAVQSHSPQISRAIGLDSGGEGILHISPLTGSGGAPDGFQIASIHMDSFFGHVLTLTGSKDFNILVLEDGKPIFSSIRDTGAPARWNRTAEFQLQSNRWVVSVTPTRALVAAEQSSLPTVFFITGLVFVALITLSVFFALRWRQNVRVLEAREAALERSEERYELAVKGSGVGLWDRDVPGNQLYLSPRVLEIMGITDPDYVADRNELLGRVHPHDIGTVGPELARAVLEKRPYDLEGRVRRLDDTYIYVRLRGVPVFDAEGTLIRVAGSLDDITQLKTAEAALKASEESFRNIMDSAAVGMALISPAKKLVKGNKALSALTGYSESEMLAMEARDLFPDAFDEDRRQIDRLLSGEIDHYEMEQMFLAKGGKPVWLLTNATLVRNPDGSPLQVVKQLLDISERKEMDRMKSEFISVVSHELRTPLTAIRGSLGLMGTAMKDALPAKALHLVEIGYRNSERLIALVNDILDMEKLAANRMPFESRLENLAALAEQAVEANQAYGEKYGVGYVVENRAADLPVLLDASRMAQILANLLSNAAKFSPEGGRVRVVIRTRAGRARIEVIDRGPGIPEEFKARIFGRFVQADSSPTRAKGGTGLGLHITRELVERMGGRIGFESQAGQGTLFWVEFPPMESQALPMPPAAPGAPALPRVLHVEDDADLTALLAAALKGRVELVPARTIREAEERLKAEDFAAVLLDVGMPDGSGLSLLERIGPLVNPPPVIILSARELDAMPDQKLAAVLVKSKIAEGEIADRLLSVLAEAQPIRRKAAS